MITRLFNFAIIASSVVSSWLFATGSWDDNGLWDDNATWPTD